MVVKDSFQDWNLFHKSVVMFFVILFSAALARGVFVVEGGTYLVEVEKNLSYSPNIIGPWINDNENRARWQAQVTEFLKFSGATDEVGSTRRVYYRRDGEEWFSFEQTTVSEPNKSYKTIQQDDVLLEDRSFEVIIEPISGCESKIILKEVIFPRDYSDRYWAFMEKSARRDRLKVSVDALERWLKSTGAECVD